MIAGALSVCFYLELGEEIEKGRKKAVEMDDVEEEAA